MDVRTFQLWFGDKSPARNYKGLTANYALHTPTFRQLYHIEHVAFRRGLRRVSLKGISADVYFLLPINLFMTTYRFEQEWL